MKRILRGRPFRGGIPLSKEPAWQAPIEIVPVPSWVVVPLLAHDGRALKPAVLKGSKVKAGDLLAEDQVPLLAPISGRVAAIEPLPHITGFRKPSVRIERLDEKEAFEPTRDFRRLGQAELLKTVWGKGLNLPPIPERAVEVLVVTGFHDDPYSAGAQRLVLEFSDTIRAGLEILQRLYACQRVLIAVEPRPVRAFAAWKEVVKAVENIALVSVSGLYPQAEEDILFSTILPRRVLKGLVDDTGCALIVEAESIFLLAEAMIWRHPVLERLITVSGSGISSPRNLRVRIGTPLSAVLSFCGVEPESLGKVVAGDAMRGWAQFDDRAGIGQETHSILLIKREDAEILREEPCLRCGWCLEACPHDLNPARLFEACRLENWEVARAYGLEECSECGACAWTCPSHLKLVHGFRFAKKEMEKRGEGRDRVPAS